MLFEEPEYIIGIGTSAGGLQELYSFFDNASLHGVSYVIVPHLSADFNSQITHLLSKHSILKVRLAENALQVNSNEVYVIPSDKYMTISEGKLYLTEKKNTKAPHYTIDKFFNSLALDQGNKAIGVLLSGLGFDGTEGIKNIKKEGGIVLARNPETAEFNSMPSNAISTGCVDFVLEPDLMPRAIQDYIKEDDHLVSEVIITNSQTEVIIQLIKEKVRIDFSQYKKATIQRRIVRRASIININDIKKYIEILKASNEEIEKLTKDFLISVTSFFRDKEAFNVIEEKILPDIFEKTDPKEEIKMWVTGCATGEEAYSLAIAVSEQLTGKNQHTQVKIFASDIDANAIRHASLGIYTAEIRKSISNVRIDKYFIPEGKNYRIKPELRKMLIFATHDLVKNPPYCNMHFISCRNVLIYMTPVLQKKILSSLQFGLKLDGYLFLGSSENPLPLIENIEVISNKWKIYKNLKNKRPAAFEPFYLPDFNSHSQLKINKSTYSNVNMSNLADSLHTTLIENLGIVELCIDSKNTVLKTYGNTSEFLVQKNFTNNLMDLLPKPLAVALNTLSQRALKSKKSETVSGIEIQTTTEFKTVSITVSPIYFKKENQQNLIVTLKEEHPNDQIPRHEPYNESIYINEYTSNLEEELLETKKELISTQALLEASNENLQSFNEELLSANEEMQSTNEEMQSINEEMLTINYDFEQKNKELHIINDDLNNYFRSNTNGQLFVDNDLNLMKFSPGTVKLINLLPSDIGRPLSNISTNIKFETITDDIKNVIDNGSTFTKEIETNNGKWYQIQMMPYILQDNRKTGAIITFNDITDLKRAQEEINETNKNLLIINSDLDNFVYTASHDLKAPIANIEGLMTVLCSLHGDKFNDEELKVIKMIHSAVIKFKTTIKDLTEISRIQRNYDEEASTIDIKDVINDVIILINDQIVSSKASINLVSSCTLSNISKSNVESIIYNLLSNAIKYKDFNRDPVITIECNQEKDYLLLKVKDNGLGIPAHQEKNIFKMFKRVHNHVDGSGVGLYLVNRIMENVGGKIVVESEVGKGSTFKLYFPTGNN